MFCLHHSLRFDNNVIGRHSLGLLPPNRKNPFSRYGVGVGEGVGVGSGAHCPLTGWVPAIKYSGLLK